MKLEHTFFKVVTESKQSDKNGKSPQLKAKGRTKNSPPLPKRPWHTLGLMKTTSHAQENDYVSDVTSAAEKKVRIVSASVLSMILL